MTEDASDARKMHDLERLEKGESPNFTLAYLTELGDFAVSSGTYKRFRPALERMRGKLTGTRSWAPGEPMDFD